jgi:hypothetical protein
MRPFVIISAEGWPAKKAGQNEKAGILSRPFRLQEECFDQNFIPTPKVMRFSLSLTLPKVSKVLEP